MSFAWPLCFLLSLPLALASWRMLRRGRHTGVRFSAVGRLPSHTAGWRARLAACAPFLFLLGCTLLIISAARPRTAEGREGRTADAISIAMTVDVSGSMEALDLTPQGENYITRLDVVKRLFKAFVEKKERENDLISLVTFGGYASSLVPLTVNHDRLLHVLASVQVPRPTFDAYGQAQDAEESLTALGDGLAMAVDRLTHTQEQMKSRIVILLSDGVSNAGAVTPEEATAAAQTAAVRVYTIGVGTKARRTPFRTRNMFGQEAIAYADMSFDETQLQTIAQETKGRYFAVGDAAGLKAALEEIDSLEKTQIEQVSAHRWNEHFAHFLSAGVLLILLGVTLQILSSRRFV